MCPLHLRPPFHLGGSSPAKRLVDRDDSYRPAARASAIDIILKPQPSGGVDGTNFHGATKNGHGAPI